MGIDQGDIDAHDDVEMVLVCKPCDIWTYGTPDTLDPYLEKYPHICRPDTLAQLRPIETTPNEAGDGFEITLKMQPETAWWFTAQVTTGNDGTIEIEYPLHDLSTRTKSFENTGPASLALAVAFSHEMLRNVEHTILETLDAT